MSEITVLVENFRSLEGPHEFDLHPITIFTGENSTGKTSALAAVYASLVWLIPQPGALAHAPFELPSMQTQLTAGATELSLGSRRRNRNTTLTAMATYQKGRKFWEPSHSLIQIDKRVRITSRGAAASRQQILQVWKDAEWVDARAFRNKEGFGSHLDMSRRLSQALKAELSLFDSRESLEDAQDLLQGRVSLSATAAIRTSPKRVYETKDVLWDPYGDNLLQTLRSLLRARGKQGRAFRNRIEEFGYTSGLFDTLSSKNYQTPAGELFSILVGRDEEKQTLRDVGYGVSQVLPILSQMYSEPPPYLDAKLHYMLLQQPEVHLHPRGQVELASAFVRQAAVGARHFLIETHSDYIVDRVRAEVKRGHIAHEKVAIYFFELVDGRTITQKITVDCEGNLLGAPDALREFFLRDQMTLMGME